MSDLSNMIPHECPVCGFMLRDADDALSYEDYGCCTDCQLHFVHRDLQGWMSGSRPEQKEIEEFRRHIMQTPSYLIPKV